MGLFKFFKRKSENIKKQVDNSEKIDENIKNATDEKIVDSFLKNEKWAIIELLNNVALSDGLSEEESEVLNNLSKILGLELNNKRSISEVEIYNTIKEFTDDQKSYVSYMVFTMVVADNKFTKEEHDEVLKLLSRAEINSSIIDDLFQRFGEFVSKDSEKETTSINRKKEFNKNNKNKIEKYDNGNIKIDYYVNKKDKYDGPYKLYYETGELLQDTFFIDGKQNYENDIYDLEGNLLRRSRLIDGEYIGETEEFYLNGKIKSVKTKVNGFDDKFKINLFDQSGNKTASLFYQEIIHENKETLTFPGVILYAVQKLQDGENFFPFGVWEIYNEDNSLKQKIDFEICKPKDCIVDERHIKFDYCSFELTNYKEGKLLSREVKPINEIQTDFFSNKFESINKRSKCIYNHDFDIFESVIKSDEFILPIIQRANKAETLEKFEVTDLNTNWVKGFSNIYKIPEDPHLASTAYVPTCHEREQSLFHPLINQEITFRRGFMDIATYCEKDALKLINEIMIFNGGVNTFKLIEDNSEGYEFVLQSPTILIAKSFGKPIKMPISNELSLDAEINVVTVTHLPPKNISGPLDNMNANRGIHWDSKHINDVLLGLNKPIYCKLDGGIMDGRFHVMDDERSDIIFSINDVPSIKYIKSIISEFSDDNSIVKLDKNDVKKLVDAYSLHNSSNELKGYSPNLNLKKEDTILCFTITGKLMVSLNLIQSNIYQTRIDKISDCPWMDLRVSSNDEFDFYISEIDDSKSLDDFNEEVRKSFIEFEQYFDDYDEFEFWDKYEISDIDLKYWLKVIRDRAGNKLMNFNEDKDLEKLTLEWIWGHADEYKSRLENPHGDPYNQTTFNHSEKIEFLKIRVVAFGEVYKQLRNLRIKINDAKNKYSVDVDTTEKHLNLEIAHAKSSLYGAIKYALNINISKEDIKVWFDDFEDNSALLNGNNPFESINLDEGLAAIADNDLIKKEFNVDMDEISKMSDQELIEELQKRGISYSGTRNELIVKLILTSNEDLLKSAGIKTNK